MKIVQIYTDGMMEDINIRSSFKNIESNILKISKDRGTCNINKLYTWSYENKTIVSYGWMEGDAQILNKHTLVSGGFSDFLDISSSDIKLYGDIFIICIYDRKIVDFQISEYGEFYTNINMYDNDDIFSESSDEDIDDSENINKCIKTIKNTNTIKNNVNKGVILRKDNMIYM